MSRTKRVIVVGAGIIGASIAWHLTRAGARVTIVEAGIAGGIATPASFAWINASCGNPEPYFRLRTRSMREWTRLATDCPGLELRLTGGLLWDLPSDKLEAYAREHGAWGYGTRTVEREEIARIEPMLIDPPQRAVHVAQEGAVEPDTAARALVRDAVRNGATLLEATEVRRLVSTGGKVTGIETSAGAIHADVVVLAAGVATPALAATVGIDVPLTTPPGLLVHSRPEGKLLNGLLLAERLHLRQTVDGRIVAGSDFGGADPGADAGETAKALFDAVKAMLDGGDRLAFDRYTVGYRPTPADGFPVIGPAQDIDGLYLAVMHSGITLAPAVGLFAAAELLGGGPEPLLTPYRLARFTG